MNAALLSWIGRKNLELIPWSPSTSLQREPDYPVRGIFSAREEDSALKGA